MSSSRAYSSRKNGGEAGRFLAGKGTIFGGKGDSFWLGK
jgi:hypothetical protein